MGGGPTKQQRQDRKLSLERSATIDKELREAAKTGRASMKFLMMGMPSSGKSMSSLTAFF
jgi:hypothetical protein